MYVTFFRYTGEAWKRMVDTPENRAVAARKLIEDVGGRMEAFYWMFGEWDGFAIYEVGDAAVAATFGAVATASGMIEGVRTQQLLTMEDVRTSLELANQLRSAYVPPGEQRQWVSEYDALG
jgi:uncharacterized protein with GYD domain